MKLLLLSDLHEEIDIIKSLQKVIEANKPYDAVLFAGDLTSISTNDLKQAKQHTIEKQYQFAKSFFQLLYSYTQCKCYYILGNHESTQKLYEDENTIYIGNKAILIENQLFIGLNGSDSSVVYAKHPETIKGFPYHPEDELEMYQQNIEEVNFLKNNVQQLSTSILTSYVDGKLQNFVENEQYSIADHLFQEINQQCIVVSHQGPKHSHSAVYIHPSKLKVTLNGSMSYSKLYRKYEDKIQFWIHGHTHHYQQQVDQKVINTGVIVVGGISIFDTKTGQIQCYKGQFSTHK